MKKVLYSLFVLLLVSSCELDQLPSDGIVSESLSSNYEGLLAATNGNYAMMKDLVEYDNKLYTANYWIRHQHQLSEYSSDNVMLSGSTTDPLFYAFTRDHFASMENTSYLWFISYRIINGANQIIAALGDPSDDDSRQLLGENYFLRAYMHLELLKLFAKPYTAGRDNEGVILKVSVDAPPVQARATVGAVYDQIEADLLLAEEYMGGGRGAAYASKVAAQALLSRVYLHMEQWQDAIDYANEVISSSAHSLENTDNYVYSMWNSPSSSEAIWYVAQTLQDDKTLAAIGSMYLTDRGLGWGEIYPSQTLRNLMNEYPEDIRNDFIQPDYDTDGVTIKTRNGYPKYFINKFSYQDDVVTLNSPQLLRVGEVYLNRAEAYAHLNDVTAALADVNAIRERAGLSGTALYTSTDFKGLSTILDVVLQERRIELAWEGFRTLDLVRNQRSINRSFPGVHLEEGETTQVIAWDDARNIYYIPLNEISNNELAEQNP
ncbi:MAG: RagB/SusD family nutrient uptake outer membrane protein [Flammeovirgaceae bacterium]|nr:RagB/SusD family nutrient uptake outer membrane protein [Flammeovirgaceae bacterium]MBR07375.1 RagB/SusD family nutrient uptake outer membrane protein [Rickettsiales bacterium]HCX21415.1 RagB/SusD family nutrient uptake outer membrane protein [Cytophagales bacterium]|tara:strand:+ start:12147 stop:13616 length:1470 start_codon:yes stop_codon:yes gene_type:complete